MGRKMSVPHAAKIDRALLEPAEQSLRLHLSAFSRPTRGRLELALAAALLGRASANLVETAPPDVLARLIVLGAGLDDAIGLLRPSASGPYTAGAGARARRVPAGQATRVNEPEDE